MQKKSKKPFKAFMVHAGTYDFSIWFVITEDIPRVIKFINYKLDLPCRDYLAVNDSDFVMALGKHFGRNGYCPVVWMPKLAVTPDEKGTLAHEIFHSVCRVMRWANIPLSSDSEEAYCHLIKYITKKFFDGC